MNLQPVDFKAVAAKGAYVYCYLRANGRPYYVGIASQGQYRRPFERHSCKPPTKQRHLARVMRSGLTLEEARRWERFYIAKFGRKGYEQNGILLNQGEGGEGGTAGIKWSPEIVEKRAAAMRGKSQRKRTPEEIEALRQRMLGTKQSAETRAKRSASSKGHKKSAGWCEKRRQYMLGRRQTDAALEKQAITNSQATADKLGIDVLTYIKWKAVEKQRAKRAFEKGVRGEGLLIAARTIGRRALNEVYKQYAAA
jgi:hypothetical protein